MKVLKFVVVTGWMLSAAVAGACDTDEMQEKVLKAAKALESLHTTETPVDEKIYSLSSQEDTYVTIFTYDRMQNLLVNHAWKAVVDHDSCSILLLQSQKTQWP